MGHEGCGLSTWVMMMPNMGRCTRVRAQLDPRTQREDSEPEAQRPGFGVLQATHPSSKFLTITAFLPAYRPLRMMTTFFSLRNLPMVMSATRSVRARGAGQRTRHGIQRLLRRPTRAPSDPHQPPSRAEGWRCSASYPWRRPVIGGEGAGGKGDWVGRCRVRAADWQVGGSPCTTSPTLMSKGPHARACRCCPAHAPPCPGPGRGPIQREEVR